jgi:hypothetical protein
MRTRLLLTLLMAGASLTACGGGREHSAVVATPDPGVATPASPPQLPPRATTTPAPVITSSGWLVHSRGNNVYASALDGSGERQLDAGSLAPRLAQYAGAAHVADDVWVYLLVPVQRVDTPSAQELYDDAVVRTSILTGAHEEVFAYGPLPLGDGARKYVSVSPDGLRIAYDGNDGVHVAHVGATIDDFLITTDCTGERCPQYLAPLWSPSGDALLLTKQYYEGSRLALVRLAEPAVVHDFEDVSGEGKVWSLDGRRFCAFPEAFVPGGVWLVEADTLARRRIDTLAGNGVEGIGCVVSGHEDVAVAYQQPISGAERLTVTVSQGAGPGAASATFALPDPYTKVEAWLPDGAGLIVSGYPPCVPCGERDPSTAVLLVDGAVRSLPFAAGQVLGVILLTAR